MPAVHEITTGAFRVGTLANEVLGSITSQPRIPVSHVTPSGGTAYLDVLGTDGQHDVRAYARGTGCTLEFRSTAVNNYRSTITGHRGVRIRTSASGCLLVKVTRWNVQEVRGLLSWLDTQSTRQVAIRAGSTSRRAAATTAARRFGVEIEFNGVSRARVAAALNDANVILREGYGNSALAWTLKTDYSVNGQGLELVSPPLSGDEGLDQLRLVLRVLRSVGAKVDRSCGLHIHHEVRDLGAVGIARLVRLWHENQTTIDWFVAPSRRSTEGHQYCNGWRDDLVSSLESAARRGDVDCRSGRYRTLNVCSYPSYGTVEVRQHGGTLEYNKIETWILFGQAMISAVANARGSDTTYAGGVRQLLTRINLSPDARSFLIGRAAEFNAPAQAIGIGAVAAVAA